MRRAVLFALALAGMLSAGPASAADASFMDGVWEGGYICGQGRTFLRLTLDGDADGVVRGSFYFGSVSWEGGSNNSVPPGEFRVNGVLQDDGSLILRGVGWVDRPAGYDMINLQGAVANVDGVLRYGGTVMDSACQAFGVRKR